MRLFLDASRHKKSWQARGKSKIQQPMNSSKRKLPTSDARNQGEPGTGTGTGTETEHRAKKAKQGGGATEYVLWTHAECYGDGANDVPDSRLIPVESLSDAQWKVVLEKFHDNNPMEIEHLNKDKKNDESLQLMKLAEFWRMCFGMPKEADTIDADARADLERRERGILVLSARMDPTEPVVITKSIATLQGDY